MNVQTKLRVGILGATGTVGHRFFDLLRNHPWFEVTVVAASANSKGREYEGMIVMDSQADIKEIAAKVDLVFSAIEADKELIKHLENQYAEAGVPVISNNSAHRQTPDVPMIIPEINPEHSALIKIQQKNHGWKKGFVAVKPNCSIQSYVPAMQPLLRFRPQRIIVTTLQAISGAGKTFETWPEMIDNVIPFISGEEDKSEQEPLKIWGQMEDSRLKLAESPTISATCIRVPISNGHMASVSVVFANKPSRAEILAAWEGFANPIAKFKLPSAPKNFLHYFEQNDRPQTKIDREAGNGMSISIGRLREDKVLDWKFVCLSHNTLRGAAGGAILLAELLVAQKYIVY